MINSLFPMGNNQMAFANPYAGTFTPMPQFNPVPSYTLAQPQGQLLKVTGIEGAKAYQAQPNTTVALFDSDEDIMYIKTTDATNNSSIRKFRFTEELDMNQNDLKYVTVEEFNNFKEELLNGKQSIRSKSTKHRYTKPTSKRSQPDQESIQNGEL